VIVENITFRLAPGVEDDAFLALDKRIQTELVPNQSGFLRRTTARRDGEWLIVTLWWSEELAAAFAESAKDHALQQEFERVTQGVSTARFETLD
jgi:heme-degrading monooxygenase HmoA